MLFTRLKTFDFRKSVAAALTVMAIALTLLVTTRHVPVLLALLVAGAIAMAGMVIYDRLARGKWEKKVARQLSSIGEKQELLARSLFRNSEEIAALREAIAENAREAAKQSSPGPVPEPEPEPERPAPLRYENIRRSAVRLQDPAVLYARRPARTHAPASRNTRPPKPGTAGSAVIAEAEEFSDTVILELLRHAIKYDRIDLFAQPVVSLPGRKVRYFELFGRVRASAGLYVPADRYLKIARQNGLLPALDKLILSRCLRYLTESGREMAGEGCILNIGSSTLKDNGFMSDLLAFISKNRELSGKLILEMREADIRNIDPAARKVLDGLSRLGCRFSMDHLEDGEIDTEFLRANKICLIKLDASWLINEVTADEGLQRINRFKLRMEAAGVAIVVEKIESAKELCELLDSNIDFGQGYHLGKPDYFSAYAKRNVNENKNEAGNRDRAAAHSRHR